MKPVLEHYVRRRLLVSVAIFAAIAISLLSTGQIFAVPPAEPSADEDGSRSRVSHDLRDLADRGQGFSRRSSLDGPVRWIKPSLPVTKGMVVVDAIATGAPGDLLLDLEAIGLQRGSIAGGMVSGRMPISSINRVENLKSLAFIRPSYMRTNVGAVTSQGDPAMRSDDARGTFGVDGTGVTVGTLSDSFDCLGGYAADIVSGDLPAGISVLAEMASCGSGTDEGRAMMQLIQDVAPGANQLFHTATGGQAAFAQGIINLKNAGADVIVDDVFYFAEPMFQDGVIAQAVDTVVAGGAAYFSSVGNDSRKAYESAFTPGQTFAADAFPTGTSFSPSFAGGVAHDFGNGDVFQQVTIPSGNSMSLTYQWDDPSASVCGGCPGADTDMDIYILNDPPTLVLNGSVANNIGADPVEITGLALNGANGSITVNIMLVKFSGPNPGLMKYIRFGSDSVTMDEHDTASGTVYGHANAAGAEAVGAAYYRDTPEFGVTPPSVGIVLLSREHADSVRYRWHCNWADCAGQARDCRPRRHKHDLLRD